MRYLRDKMAFYVIVFPNHSITNWMHGFKESTVCRILQNGGPTCGAANNLPLRGAKNTLWEGGTKGAAFVYSKTLLHRTGYTNTEYGKCTKIFSYLK